MGVVDKISFVLVVAYQKYGKSSILAKKMFNIYSLLVNLSTTKILIFLGSWHFAKINSIPQYTIIPQFVLNIMKIPNIPNHKVIVNL